MQTRAANARGAPGEAEELRRMASSSQALPPRALPSPSSAAPAPPPSRSTSLLCMLRTGHHITVASTLDTDD